MVICALSRRQRRRLSFSNGILLLIMVAGLLIIIYQGDTEHLISLYAIGVFLSLPLRKQAWSFTGAKKKVPAGNYVLLSMQQAH